MVTVQFNPIDPTMLSDPYPAYRNLRENDPVHWNALFECWIYTRYPDVDSILMDPRFSADRTKARNRFAQMVQQQQEEFGPFSRAQTMLSSDPPAHTRLRKLVSKAFTPRAVENLRPRIQEIVDNLLDGLEGQGGFDLVDSIAYPLPVIVIAEMLGVPPEDRAQFKKWSDDVVATLGGPFTPKDVFQRARQSIEEMATYISHVIADRRAHPREDLISGLIAAEEEGQVLSEEEIFATTILLLVAGNETTTNLIGNCVVALLRNPDQLEYLRADLSRMPAAVEELLRFAGPVQATARVAKEDIDLGGQVVKEGQVAFAFLAAANRDPAKFAEPDRLDLSRNPQDHLSFGDGIHFCLGAPLARAEAQITLRALLERYPHIEFAGDPTWGGTFIIRGVKHLPLRV